jgi:hypothetical protein
MNEASDINMGSVLGVMRACKPQDHDGKAWLLCQSTHKTSTAYRSTLQPKKGNKHKLQKKRCE